MSPSPGRRRGSAPSPRDRVRRDPSQYVRLLPGFALPFPAGRRRRISRAIPSPDTRECSSRRCRALSSEARCKQSISGYRPAVSILIAEDEKKTAAFLQKGLREAGYEVVVAEDGANALRLASTKPFDLAIVDVMLPKLDGWHVVR